MGTDGFSLREENYSHQVGMLNILCLHIVSGLHILFYKQPQFRVEPRVALKIPKMRLKVEVTKYFWNRGSRSLSNLTILGSNVWKTGKNWQKLLRISIWKN